MSSAPEHNPTLIALPALSPEARAAYDYASLLRVTRILSEAADSRQALSQLQRYLLERYRVYTIALETIAGDVTHFLPFGDTSDLTEAERQRIAESDMRIQMCRIKDPTAPPGRMTYIYANESPLSKDLLEAVTAQVAIKLGNENLMKRAEDAEDKALQRISEVATIYEIGQAIDQIEMSDLLKLITERTALLMEAQACSLMLVDADGKTLRMEASYGLSDDASIVQKLLGEGIAGRVAITEQPLRIAKDCNDPRLNGIELRPDISSSMLVPMKDQEGRVLGVLSIRRRAPAPDFTEDDLRLFTVFATQAALAVTNFRLYDNLERRANELLKVSTLSRSLISTLDLDQLLNRVAEDICKIVNFDRCCLFLRDGARPHFLPKAWRGYPDTIGRNPVREGEGAVGVAARSKAMFVFDSRAKVEPERERERLHLLLKGFARALGTDAYVVAPILTSKNRCLGVIVADNRGRRDPISSDQISLLSAFVNQAGIAIENAYLYLQMQEHNRNITRLRNYTESVLQSSLAGIISTDGRGVIARWNQAAEATLDKPAEDFREVKLTDFIRGFGLPDYEENRLQEMVRRVQETGEPFHHPKFTLHPPSAEPVTFNLMISRLAEPTPERAGLVIIFEDVTQEVRLEAKVKEMHRLADIGQLGAKMAHEVRNALSPIKGAAQIIRLELEGQGASVEWPDIIIAEVDGLSRLTSEMLDFARPTTLDPRPLNVESFLMGAAQSLSTFLEEHRVTTHWSVPSDLPELSADPILLGQVVRNIVMNAAQAMSSGGDLFIVADFDRHARRLALHFRDTGVGIPEEDLERIFRPFVTTKTKGTGLGLPIVQKVVNHHGGQVAVKSRPGEGTTFSIYLPLNPPLEAIQPLPDGTPVISAHPDNPFPDR